MFYATYEAKASEIREIWEYVYKTGRTDRKTDFSADNVTSLLIEMRKELHEVKAKINT